MDIPVLFPALGRCGDEPRRLRFRGKGGPRFRGTYGPSLIRPIAKGRGFAGLSACGTVPSEPPPVVPAQIEIEREAVGEAGFHPCAELAPCLSASFVAAEVLTPASRLPVEDGGFLEKPLSSGFLLPYCDIRQTFGWIIWERAKFTNWNLSYMKSITEAL
jgi:hypothetical protein